MLLMLRSLAEERAHALATDTSIKADPTAAAVAGSSSQSEGTAGSIDLSSAGRAAGPMVLEGGTSKHPAGGKEGPHPADLQPCLSLMIAGEGSSATGRAVLRGMNLVSSADRLRLLWESQVRAAVRRYGHFLATTAAAATSPPDAASQGTAAGSIPAPHSLPPSTSPSSLPVGATAAQPPLLPAAASSRQLGVLHVSCWNAVDEVLAVQHVVGEAVLRDQLVAAGLMGDKESLEGAYPEVCWCAIL